MEDQAERTVSHIGGYQVMGELGHGGMAVVYRARDPRLEREVAVKVLHPHLAKDVESRARFEREARAAARLRHPNIVEVYEFSGADARESYLVTELLEGPTLRRFAEQHPDIPAEVVAAIGVVLCSALGCAHKQGVIHRDVKPDNIMLQQGGLKLTDFGIAHVADSSHVTVTGQVLGSPAHMAPEQIEGGAVDARTDLFAAGTVLYYLAVGRLPFEGNNAHALLRKILEAEYADPVRVAPGVGHRLAAIIRRALEREPERRYPSAEAMRDDLAGFLSEVGWDVPERELRRYFEDPEGVALALREKLLTALPERGLALRRAGDVPGAMGYFNRALALDPGNARVLSLVRGLARRRRVVQAARAGVIVAVAAAGTMSAALVLARREPVSTGVVIPRVEPSGLSDGQREAPEMVRGSLAPRLVAPVASEVVADAGVASVEPSGRDPRRASGGNGGHARRPPEREPPRVVETAGETREVQLVPFPVGVQYTVNGQPRGTWSSQNPTIGRYPVGTVLRIELTPIDETCGRTTWERRVEAGGPDAGAQVIRVGRCVRRRPTESTAQVGDGGSPTL